MPRTPAGISCLLGRPSAAFDAVFAALPWGSRTVRTAVAGRTSLPEAAQAVRALRGDAEAAPSGQAAAGEVNYERVGKGVSIWTARDGRVFTSQAEYVAYERWLFRQSRTLALPAAEEGAIRQRVLANIAESQAARNASNFHVHAAYEQLGQLRRELGLPNTGVRETDGVLTLLEVNGRRFYGINNWAASDDAAKAAFINAEFRNPVTGNVPHRVVANHAEGDVFLQAFLAGQRGGHGRLYIDSTMCGFCGRSGGVRGMARGLGLDSLEVFEQLPNGSIRRIPNLLE
jgi:hypothetical protein